jgi:phosphatidylglycerol:prolipoprotein diacylglycerol transferase
MFPVLPIAGHTVDSYGLFIALGYLASLATAGYLAPRRGLARLPYLQLGFVLLLSSLLGARLLFVLTNWGFYRAHPGQIANLWSGGLVFYGGFLFGFPACLLYLRRHRLPVALSLDIIAPSLAFAHALGRIGCFAAGCCYGRACPYPWAVQFPPEAQGAPPGTPLHPTQLYESAALFLLGAFLFFFVKRGKGRPGTAALLYLVLYSAARFAIEGFRGDAIRGFVLGGALSTSQAIALVLFLGGGLALIRDFRRDH